MRTLDSPDDYQEIVARLARLTAENPRRWGRLSPHEALCHLADAFRCALGERERTMATTWLWRTVVKWIALRMPFHWPHGVPTRPEVDPRRSGTHPTDFTRDRAALEALTQRMAELPAEGAAGQHPMFGPLTRWEWQRWAYLHLDHHLRQFGV
jgi:hypothetical protein